MILLPSYIADRLHISYRARRHAEHPYESLGRLGLFKYMPLVLTLMVSCYDYRKRLGNPTDSQAYSMFNLMTEQREALSGRLTYIIWYHWR